MLPKHNLKRGKKRDLIVLVIHIHFLVFALIAVLWGRSQLKPLAKKPVLERKAKFIPPAEKALKQEKSLK